MQLERVPRQQPGLRRGLPDLVTWLEQSVILSLAPPDRHRRLRHATDTPMPGQVLVLVPHAPAKVDGLGWGGGEQPRKNGSTTR